MSKLSKSKEEYIQNGGWSSHNFIEHAKVIIPELEKLGYVLDFGRHVIHLKKDNETVLKFYVHYNGRSREYMTITDKKGTELKTYHCNDNPIDIFNSIKEVLGK